MKIRHYLLLRTVAILLSVGFLGLFISDLYVHFAVEGGSIFAIMAVAAFYLIGCLGLSQVCFWIIDELFPKIALETKHGKLTQELKKVEERLQEIVKG